MSPSRLTAVSYFNKSRIDYFGLYALLYASYNAWHRGVIDAASDRDALRGLKRDVFIWEEYYEGSCMSELRSNFKRIVEFTSKGWPMQVDGVDDWRGLIDFWYKMRCELVHGQMDPGSDSHMEGLVLAYDSLSIYMGEVVRRLKAAFSRENEQRLEELQVMAKVGRLSKVQERERSGLYSKFLNAN